MPDFTRRENLKHLSGLGAAILGGGAGLAGPVRADDANGLIAEENARKPLSDNAIANLLKDDGIDVARRTVAKYRESLHIPSSSERKVLI